MSITQRLAQVQQRIADACEQAKRDPAEITLLAVSKTKPPADIRTAWDAQQIHFGENYVQEWREKHEELQDLQEQGLQWHFIGHLQRNKCKYIAGHISLIHTVDSLSLLRELEKRTPPTTRQAVLLQLNLAQEGTKSGLQALEQLDPLLAPTQPWERISIQGLMAIPPYDPDPEASRHHFQQLKQAQQALQERHNLPLPQLSMGMSHDLEVAIQEGATIVRVGTAIFGPRS